MLNELIYGGLCLLTGAAVTAAAARWRIKRTLARAGEAERRARGAERLAELGAMTGGLAHEIKNPLSTISLNAQLLAEGIDELPGEPETKARLSRRVAALRREVERLRGILTDFLEYAGELRLEPIEADLNEVVAELVDFFLPQAEKNGVRLRTDLCEGKLLARIDVQQFKQALLNLMLNAVQAMSLPAASGGSTTKDLILKTDRSKEKPQSGSVVVHVIDTGPGISAEAMPKLFRPYFTTKSGGTGLGLPTTRRIIEAHRGRIDVHSEVGKGSDFVLTLPAADHEHASHPS